MVNPWNLVNDILPAQGKKVIVMCEDQTQYIASLESGNKWRFYSKIYISENKNNSLTVINWMELPIVQSDLTASKSCIVIAKWEE